MKYLHYLFTLFLFHLFFTGLKGVSVIIASSIPDYTDRQTYLGEPPYGMNAKFAWQFSDGKGDGVKIVVIDRAYCNTHHYDLDKNVNGAYASTGNHGAAVAGILAAEENDFGITGFAPNA